jgi:ketosteroid isomerase-like protein
MRSRSSSSRRKLTFSLAVLAIVLVIAAIAQVRGKGRRVNPYANGAEQAPIARSAPQAAADERPVFGDTPAAASRVTPKDRPTATEAMRGRTTAAPSKSDDIHRLLDEWRSTLVRGDVNAQANLYAPRVDRFFTKRNVSRDAVRKEKSRMMAAYPEVNRYEISDIRVESNTGDEAVVSFRKEWEMTGNRRFSGAERQRLRLRRFGGDWKIVGEEETKIYWVKRA